MYVLRISPRLWAWLWRRTVDGLVWRTSNLELSVHEHLATDSVMVVHVDDLLISSDAGFETFFFNIATTKFDIKHLFLVEPGMCSTCLTMFRATRVGFFGRRRMVSDQDFNP